jgi:hypothetical protein
LTHSQHCCINARVTAQGTNMKETTDIYGLALFGIWTVLLAAVWAYILYDRHKSRKAKSKKQGNSHERPNHLVGHA